MNNANVISVNPGVKTMGELNMPKINLARISRKLTRPGNNTPHFRKALHFALGIDSKTTSRFSGKMAIVRLITGCLFISFGIVPLIESGMNPGACEPIELLSLALGISVFFGFMTRIVTIAATGFFAYLFYTSMTVGEPDMLYLLSGCISAIICVLGPGRYSLDQLMSRGLQGIHTRSRQSGSHRRSMETSVGYNAFGSVDRRVKLS